MVTERAAREVDQCSEAIRACLQEISGRHRGSLLVLTEFLDFVRKNIEGAGPIELIPVELTVEQRAKLQAYDTTRGKAPTDDALRRLETKDIVEWQKVAAVFRTEFRNLLPAMVLVYVVAVYEAFLKDYLEAVLCLRPGMMKGPKMEVSAGEVCDIDSLVALYAPQAQQTVDKLLRGGIDCHVDRIQEQFGIRIVGDFAYWETLREAYYRRNVIVHHSGTADSRYCRKYPSVEAGTRLTPDTPYVLQATESTSQFIHFLNVRITTKIGLGA